MLPLPPRPLFRPWRQTWKQIRVFALHPRLAADTLPLADLGLCTVRLMNDSSYPWLILVPTRPDLTEILDLDDAARACLMEEITLSARAVREVCSPDKLNVGALGNLVPQLHIHVVGRFKSDRAWPGPLWDAGSAVPYEQAAAERLQARLRHALLGTNPQ